jgi:GNAT superfamily N-acetyltransferase
MSQHHYTISIEPFEDAFADFEPLTRLHYEEMRSRLAAEGIPIGPYKPRFDVYRRAANDGYLFTFVVRKEDGEAVGHATIYLQQSMHNSEYFAREDTMYIRPDHRNGIGRRLVKFILETMKEKGAKTFVCQAGTDLRVGKLYKRLGFQPTAETMTLVY